MHSSEDRSTPFAAKFTSARYCSEKMTLHIATGIAGRPQNYGAGVQKGDQVWLNYVNTVLQDAMSAFAAEDEAAAKAVIDADDAVDYDFNTIKQMLAAEIAADPGKVDAALDLLMVIKYLERIGDHAVNLAEWVEFVRSGRYHNENMF